MRTRNARAVLLATTMLAAAAGPASATNGYFGHCIGVYSCGMGGAGVALPQDASNGGINPALMARLGNEVIVAPSWFHPVRTMDLSGTNPAAGVPNTAAGKQTSDHENYVEGSLGANYRMSDSVAFGVSVYGSGGMATSYERPRTNPAIHTPPGAFYDSRVSYRLAHVVPTMAWAPDKSQAYGFGVVLGYADIKTDFATLPAFAQTAGQNQRDEAFGIGFRVGGL